MAPGPTPVSIPWDEGPLKDIIAQLVPEAEKFARARLEARAERISPDVAKLVREEAGWNPTAKGAIVAAGPKCVAEILNDAGIGADRAHWVALVTAVGTIASSHLSLASKLDRLAKAPPAASAP